MSRTFDADTFYAGYIKYTYTDNAGNLVVHEVNYGPYSTTAPAQSAVTTGSKYLRPNAGYVILESGVRKANISWEKLDLAQDKKERAKQLRAEKKQKELDKIQAKRDEFFAELDMGCVDYDGEEDTHDSMDIY